MNFGADFAIATVIAAAIVSLSASSRRQPQHAAGCQALCRLHLRGFLALTGTLTQYEEFPSAEAWRHLADCGAPVRITCWHNT